MREAMPATMNDWQKATRIETQRYKLLQTGHGIKRFEPTQNTGNGYQKKDPNAMETDATTSVPFRKLTDDERKQYMKEGRCFRCRQQRQMIRERAVTIKVTCRIYYKEAQVNVLLDSGATDNLIDRNLINKIGLGTTPLKPPRLVRNVDGSLNKDGTMTET